MASIEINSFHGGMNLAINPLLLKSYEASLAKNVDLSEIGTLKKARGYQLFKKLSETTNSDVKTLYSFYKIESSGITRFLLAEWNNGLYKYNFSTNSWEQITGTINTTENSQWVTYKNLAIRFNKNDAPKKFDGTNLSNLGGNPPQASYGVLYKERIYVAGFAPNFSTVWFSDIGDPEKWNPNNQFDVGANDGDRITGLAVLGDSLLIFKENSIWEIQVDQQNVISFKRLFAQSIGTTSARSIVNINNVLFFFDRNGIWAIYQRYPELISAKIQPFINAIQDVYSVVGWGWKNKYFLYVGDITYQDRLFKNVVLAYDTVYNQWFFYTFAHKILSQTDFIKADNTKTLYLGSQNSDTFEFDKGFSFGGYPIEVEYELPLFQPEDIEKRKLFKEVVVRLKDVSKSKPSISVSIDGGDFISLGFAEHTYSVFPIARKLGREEGRDLRLKILEVSDKEMNEIYQIVINWSPIKTVQPQK